MTNRLTREDWVKKGLDVLASEGAGLLKADVLAKALRVTRGSFYWHFESLEDFHQAVRGAWAERTTASVIAALEEPGHAGDRLEALILLAFQADGKLERGMRGWATQDARVAADVVTVDGMRLEYLRKILREAGVPEAEIAVRAAAIYWANLGRLLVDRTLTKDVTEEGLEALARLFQSGQ